MKINLLFPHQLFEAPLFQDKDAPVYLVEEHLFFNQYPFHKQKLAFHRASMKYYEEYLEDKGFEVVYVEVSEDRSDIRKLIKELAEKEVEHITFVNPVDDWLERRLDRVCTEHEIQTEVLETPSFLNSNDDLSPFFRSDKKKFFQTTFYKDERKKRGILLTGEDQPVGGKWSFDADNRKKYPKNKVPPAIQFPNTNAFYKEAREYVQDTFPDNYGALPEYPLYAITHEGTKEWMNRFFETRFAEFGPYEDAIVAQESILGHSVLTPYLNSGLLTPNEVIQGALDYADDHDIPINSLEGFIRQIIGWREFIRGVYSAKGREERTTNFWNFNRPIPDSFYDGTTGIPPIDITIKKVLQTGYCHHIERLMVLGNFMMLCEFDPDEVYQWFMELFIDAYDWVMVPNVYGMSQFADGGLMSTKPYISGSNYLMKMSDYSKGEWQETWDALFWRFMDVHRDFFTQNPRLGMLVGTLDKMNAETRTGHIERAEEYLASL